MLQRHTAFFIPLPHRSRDHCVRGWHAQRPRLVRSLFLDCKSSVRNTNSHALLCLLAVKLRVYVSQEPSTFIFNSHLHVKNDGVLSPVQKKKVERKEKYGQWMVIEIFVLFIITVGLLDTDWQVWIYYSLNLRRNILYVLLFLQYLELELLSLSFSICSQIGH